MTTWMKCLAPLFTLAIPAALSADEVPSADAGADVVGITDAAADSPVGVAWTAAWHVDEPLACTAVPIAGADTSELVLELMGDSAESHFSSCEASLACLDGFCDCAECCADAADECDFHGHGFWTCTYEYTFCATGCIIPFI